MNKKRVHILFAFFCLCSFVLLFRLYFLQVVKHPAYESMATVREKLEIGTSIPRNGICDRHGREMALSVLTPSAYLVTKDAKNPKTVLKALSRLPWVNMRPIKDAFKKNKGFVWIKRKINPNQQEYLDRLKFEEINFVMEPERFYPNLNVAAQILGFVGIDGKGLEGLEYYLNHFLDTCSDCYPRGFSSLCVDTYCLNEKKECDIFLTLDLAMQYFAEDALGRACQKVGAKHGILIVMDTYTGEIYAMANWPGYNPNHFADYPMDYWRNRCVTDIYEPGSIFKIFWAAALLEEGMMATHHRVDCQKGSMKIAGRRIRDHKKFGVLTFRQVLEKSSNIGAIKCAQKLGDERFYQYIKQFGFGERTGIDFPGESKGILRPPEDWSGLSLASLAIGQEISITPIQMITAFSALVNGGQLMTPFILKEVRDSKGEILLKHTPTVKTRIVSQRTSRQMKEILRGVVDHGTGVRAQVPGYWIGGKTGTAQMVDKSTGEYSHEDFLTSFIGFFPDSEARWGMLVMVSQPQKACWGGEVAAPIFKEVAERIIRYLHIPPVNPDTGHQLTMTAKL